MSKPKSPSHPAPGGASPEADQPTYRNNPEIDARIDGYIRDNPKYWAFVQGMSRERLERTLVLHELRELERRERIREGVVGRINRNPELKRAYEQLVKDLPEDQREDVMTQLDRQRQRAVARSQVHSQGQSTRGTTI